LRTIGEIRGTMQAAAAVLSLTLALAVPAIAQESLRDRYVGRCHDRFTAPVALGVLGGAPVVFGSAHVIEVFGAGVSDGPQPNSFACHTVTGVVAAALAADSTIYLAEPTQIDRVAALYDGGSWIPSAIVPPLGPRDRIETLAVNGQGQIEAVVSTNGDPAQPRFLLFDRLATNAATPLRDFISSRIASPVSAVAFDARGELYVYDEAGEILEFSSNASGSDPMPLRTIAGPLTLLRPALPAPRGTRPLTVDPDGDIIAGDDRFILTFAKDASGDAAPIDAILSNDRVYGLGTDARGFLYVLRVTATGPPPPTMGVRIYESGADRARGGAAAGPLKDEVIVVAPGGAAP
jgi:hypothetical protein